MCVVWNAKAYGGERKRKKTRKRLSLRNTSAGNRTSINNKGSTRKGYITYAINLLEHNAENGYLMCINFNNYIYSERMCTKEDTRRFDPSWRHHQLHKFNKSTEYKNS